MATDKALPNVQQTIKLPSPKDVQIEQQQQTAQQMTEPVDIQKMKMVVVILILIQMLLIQEMTKDTLRI